MTKVKEPSKSKVAQKADPSREYVPTADEKGVIEKRASRMVPLLPILRIKDGEIKVDHEDPKAATQQLFNAFGTTDPNFANGLLSQLQILSISNKQFAEGLLNSYASIVAAVEPRDPVESLWAINVATTQKLIYDLTCDLGLAKGDRAQNFSLINKLLRTFTIEMDALNRHRSKGEQQVTVQHVTVGQGGQAIVGDVHQQSREVTKASVGPPALTRSSELPMQPPAEVSKEVVVVKKGTRK
jgi:hypothetical protein